MKPKGRNAREKGDANGINNVSGPGMLDFERKYLPDEHLFVGPVINRKNLGRWREEGGLTLRQRARHEVDRLVTEWQPNPLGDDTKEG